MVAGYTPATIPSSLLFRAEMVGHGTFAEQEYRDNARFRRAINEFLHGSDERVREAGLTPRQWLMLLAIRGHDTYPAVSVRSVADALKVRQSSASALIDRAVTHGLLRRVQDAADRRRTMVSLTAHGQELLDRLMEANRRDVGRLEGAFADPVLRAALTGVSDTSR